MDSMNIQWYPGHMTKTRRQMEQDLKLVDAVCELLDARIPISSRNPDIAALCGPKPRLVILNRMDMADPAATRAWCEAFRRESLAAVATDCKSRRGLTAFVPAVRNLLQEKIARNAAKGQNRPLKIMVVGIPNVGKSSLINKLCRGGKAAVADRPGVTRENRWFTIGKGFELLDTPGVLWPKFEDPVVGEHLAFTGAVKDEVVDTERLASRLLEALVPTYPKAVCERYRLEESFLPGRRGDEILEAIGKNRGMLMAGGVINTERAAAAVLDEFRSARLGRITLERVEE